MLDRQASVMMFLSVPRTAEDIGRFLGAKTAREAFYAIREYVSPLIARGLVVKNANNTYEIGHTEWMVWGVTEGSASYVRKTADGRYEAMTESKDGVFVEDITEEEYKTLTTDCD